MLNMLKYFICGFKRINCIELLLLFEIILAAFEPRKTLSIYLWSITALCALAIVIAHGAYVTEPSSNPKSKPAFSCRFGGIVTAILLFAHFQAIALMSSTEDLSLSYIGRISTYSWYVIVMSAVFECFYCILQTLHHTNNSWLAGTKGRVGVPNAISICRIGLAICVPHIYVCRSFGPESNTIATIILGVALSTDAIDGYIARSFNAITKAGKALDPLGDKLIFYPVAIGFYIATSAELISPIESIPNWTIHASAVLIALRDILVIIWFFIFGKKYENGIGAGKADKIRAIILSFWLSSTALAITIPETTLGIAMIWTSFISLILAGIASPISFFVDINRIMRHKK